MAAALSGISLQQKGDFMGLIHTDGKYGNLSTAIGLYDGHGAGDKNGRNYTANATYELFLAAGCPLLNDHGEHIGPKGDGPYACVSGRDEFRKMQVLRPPDLLDDIIDGVYFGGPMGSDVVFDKFPGDVKPFLGKGAREQLLDPEGHEQAFRTVLEKNGFEYVFGIYVRTTLTGFAAPAEWEMDTTDGKRKIVTVGDMNDFEAFHRRKYNRDPVVASEYPRFAAVALDANGIQHYKIVISHGSTENRLRGRADMILETVETGSQLNRVDARLLVPVVSLNRYALIMRKDTPPAGREMMYSLRELLASGQENMKITNPKAFCLKLNPKFVGWNGNNSKLPEKLEGMLVAAQHDE